MKYNIIYSVCDFESSRTYNAVCKEQVYQTFLAEVIEQGGLEESDIDYYTIVEAGE